MQIHYGKKNDKESQQKILYFADQRHFGTVKFIQGEAELNKKLVLVGQGNKVEIWSETHWQEGMSSWLREGAEVMGATGDDFSGLSV